MEVANGNKPSFLASNSTANASAATIAMAGAPVHSLAIEISVHRILCRAGPMMYLSLASP